MERVITYIDGFNLYFGLKTKGWKRCYWLNLQMLAMNLLKDNQELVMIKYFTSRISGPPDKSKRQRTFLEALETLGNFHMFYGHYLTNTIECQKCGAIFPKPNEKMTDVNIAVEMLTDAFQNKFDTAILISADTVLKPAHIKPPAGDERFNYIVDLYSRWYRNYFYFCSKYACPGPNAISLYFEAKFARLEYVGYDRFHLAFMRHTGKWCEIYINVSLDECLAAIRDEPHFLP